jgi:hypothetical protein
MPGRLQRRKMRNAKKRCDVLGNIVRCVDNYTRLEKIKALVDVQVPINRKCDKNRVDKKLKDSYEKATQVYSSIREKRIAANRKRRARKQRSLQTC